MKHLLSTINTTIAQDPLLSIIVIFELVDSGFFVMDFLMKFFSALMNPFRIAFCGFLGKL